MLIRYYINNKEYAARTRDIAPRAGDSVRFKGVNYNVLRVIWIEDQDEDRPQVRINIKKDDF